MLALIEYFYRHVNLFRTDPYGYQTLYNITIGCTDTIQPTHPVYEHPCLVTASWFQSWSQSFANCTHISHQTCPIYCHLFCNDCSYIARFDHYCPDHDDRIAEILIKGPRQPERIFHEFLRSPHHCNHILQPDFNSIGCTFHDHDYNIFVCDLAYLQCWWSKNLWLLRKAISWSSSISILHRQYICPQSSSSSSDSWVLQ